MNTFKAACIQVKAYGIEEKQTALEKTLSLIDHAAKEKPKLIVLPECIYPAYFLKQTEIEKIDPSDLDQALKSIKEKAKQHSIYLAFGMVEKKKNELFNSAYLIDTCGNEIAIARKQFLWHFDSLWFSRGKDFCLVDTELGKIGMIICADGRQPEITRILALQGAQVIIDVANLVASGFEPQQLTNQQCEFMLSTRAVENGVWMIVANKTGVEANSIVYCGRSCIINPEGHKVAEASPHNEEIVYGDIELQTKKFASRIGLEDINSGRFPSLYNILSTPEEKLPISHLSQNDSKTVKPGNLFASVVQLEYTISLQDYYNKLNYYSDVLSQQGVKLIVFPETQTTNNPDNLKEIESIYCKLSQKYCLRIIGAAAKYNDKFTNKISLIYNCGNLEKEYSQTHLTLQERINQIARGKDLSVLNTTNGNIGLMKGVDGFFPEMARALMLLGADYLIWQINYDFHQFIPIARSRAAENKVWLLAANTVKLGKSMIINPSGQIVSGAFEGTEQAISTGLEPSLSRNKYIVPNTNVVSNRHPEKYHYLIK